MFNTISMIGLGYIGLPTATLFASRKIRVRGVDINPQIVSTINQGGIHFVEPELDMLVHSVVTEGYLQAATTPAPADAFLIAVPTPFTEGHKPDLSHIQAAASSIAPVLQAGNLVILESTSPVGTTEKLASWLAQVRPDLTFPQHAGEEADVQVAYCPERVLPGHIVRELVENDRIIGGLTHRAGETAARLYSTFVEGECILTDARTAEMCKLAENTYRDINIAYANELSMICDGLNIDVWKLILLANRHPRVNILKPGAGVGGHCIAVDPWFIVDQAPDDARLIRAAREVNERKTAWVLERIEDVVASEVRNGTAAQHINIACLGLAYKPDIDDLRESPALSVVKSLAKNNAGRIAVVEPNIAELPRELRDSGVALMALHDTIDWATIIVLLVEHKQFRDIRFDESATAHIIDAIGLGKK